MTQPTPHRWQLTPTALLRSHAPPVFLHPRHWLEGCWPCASRSPQQQQLIVAEARKIERRKRVFEYPPGPSLAELREATAAVYPDDLHELPAEIAAAWPARGGSEAAFQAAHERWREAMKKAHGHNGWVNQPDIDFLKENPLPYDRKG